MCRCFSLRCVSEMYFPIFPAVPSVYVRGSLEKIHQQCTCLVYILALYFKTLMINLLLFYCEQTDFLWALSPFCFVTKYKIKSGLKVLLKTSP